MADRAPSSLMVESALHKAIERGELRSTSPRSTCWRAGLRPRTLMRLAAARSRCPWRVHPAGRRERPDRALSRWPCARRSRQAKVWQTAWIRRPHRGEHAHADVRAQRPWRPSCWNRAQWRSTLTGCSFEITETGLMKDLQAASRRSPAQRDGRADLHRRLRHGLFVAGLSDHAAHQRAEEDDRSFVKDWGSPMKVRRWWLPSSPWLIHWACTAWWPRASRRSSRCRNCTAWVARRCRASCSAGRSRPTLACRRADGRHPLQQLARWQSHLRSPMTARAGDLPATSRL